MDMQREFPTLDAECGTGTVDQLQEWYEYLLNGGEGEAIGTMMDDLELLEEEQDHFWSLVHETTKHFDYA
jgi:hypothetical protein